jgi:formiminotetrahydrofolate cyclodeaminase
MTAKLKDYSKLSVRDFLNELGASTSTPGGGSAAALVAATSCALLEMVVGINHRRINKTSSQPSQKVLKLLKIRARLLNLMTDDVKAFRTLREALKKATTMPERNQVYLRAAKTPFDICEACMQIAVLCASEKKNTSLWLMSDWREVLILTRTAFYSAWLNVEANLSLVKDAKACKSYHRSMKSMQNRIDAYAQN